MKFDDLEVGDFFVFGENDKKEKDIYVKTGAATRTKVVKIEGVFPVGEPFDNISWYEKVTKLEAKFTEVEEPKLKVSDLKAGQKFKVISSGNEYTKIDNRVNFLSGSQLANVIYDNFILGHIHNDWEVELLKN